MDRRIVNALALVVALGGVARADVVTLDDGSRVEGEVVSETKDEIVVKVRFGTTRVRPGPRTRVERRPVPEVAPVRSATAPTREDLALRDAGRATDRVRAQLERARRELVRAKHDLPRAESGERRARAELARVEVEQAKVRARQRGIERTLGAAEEDLATATVKSIEARRTLSRVFVQRPGRDPTWEDRVVVADGATRWASRREDERRADRDDAIDEENRLDEKHELGLLELRDAVRAVDAAARRVDLLREEIDRFSREVEQASARVGELEKVELAARVVALARRAALAKTTQIREGR
jgi:hypothetical protein